jgi:trans-aconitate 2-methyltransferase
MSVPLTPSDHWNAHQYLKFDDQRARSAVDLGCGPGNSTQLLIDRFPDAAVVGLDSSPDMLQQEYKRLPLCAFIQADLAT